MSTELGRRAEDLAAVYLEKLGWKILERNWRNRWCELDIVARCNSSIHFVEVKYRRYTSYGAAIEYITSDKSARLRRAAAAWAQYHNYNGPYQIDALSIEGNLDHPIITLLENAVQEG